MICAAAWPQEAQTQSQQEDPKPPSDQKAPPPQKRPSLGPAPAPTLYGPKTSTTADSRRLSQVKKIYIERMDNALDEKLIEEFAKARRFRIVGDRKEADAVLRGTCFDARRLKVLRSEVYLNEVSGAAIWQDSIRRPIHPPAVAVAVSETATMIAAHLNDSLVEAERH
jgi:hypothetical protein